MKCLCPTCDAEFEMNASPWWRVGQTVTCPDCGDGLTVKAIDHEAQTATLEATLKAKAETFSLANKGCIVYVVDGKPYNATEDRAAHLSGALQYVYYPRSHRTAPARNGRQVTVADDVRAAEQAEYDAAYATIARLRGAG